MKITLPRISEDEAYTALISTLRHSAKAGETVDLTDIILKYMQRYRNPGPGSYQYDANQPNAALFYSVAWRLCTRGVLAQAPTFIHQNYGGMAGVRFTITEYGERWLSKLSDYDVVPTDYGRFSQLLSNHARRLESGYHARSQEAVNCYRAHMYLACCVMCGGAAESILLTLAIMKTGDEQQVLRDYMTNTGRTKIENKLLAHANSHIQQELRNYTTLLKYWRDAAAHGADTNISEGEAFTSLLLLLRFAQFADDRWDELTT